MYGVKVCVIDVLKKDRYTNIPLRCLPTSKMGGPNFRVDQSCCSHAHVRKIREGFIWTLLLSNDSQGKYFSGVRRELTQYSVAIREGNVACQKEDLFKSQERLGQIIPLYNFCSERDLYIIRNLCSVIFPRKKTHVQYNTS